MLEKRVSRRTFGCSRDKVTGEWRKLQSEELNVTYCSPNTVQVIKSRMVGYVTCMGKRIGTYRVLVGKPEEKRPLEHPGVYGRIIFKCIFRTWWHGLD